MKRQQVNTLIIGGGQAGLSISYYLSQAGHNHLILDQAALPAEAWRNQRWDSFTLLTPNWMIRLPGAEYQGDSPHGFMSRLEIIQYLENYLERYGMPVRYGVRVGSVEPAQDGYLLRTSQGEFLASNVVVATGSFRHPKIPAFSANLSGDILRLHSSAYRNPAQLPAGAVLVVGSAQSGCQIAEELYLAGRKVYLCVGTAGRLPRRYRGRDTADWFYELGGFDRTPDMLPSPKARFAGNPHVSGKDGGHTLNLHQFTRDGVTLLGHIRSARDHRIELAPDLHESLAKADQFEADLVKAIDGYIAKNGINAPEDEVPVLRDGYSAPLLTELDLHRAGVSSVIWAMGFTFDSNLVRLPVYDEFNYPVTSRGVTRFPGLYFVGLHFLHSAKSTLLLGVGEDARYVAEHIAARQPD